VGLIADARDAVRVFFRARGRVLGASVAFYAMLSVAPMLVIVLRVAGAVTRRGKAHDVLLAQLTHWVGADGARTIGAIVDRSADATSGTVSSVVSAVLLVYSATRLFSALEYALDAMWGVTKPEASGLRDKALRQLRKRGAAFVIAFVIAIVLLSLQGIRALLALASIGATDAPAISQATEAIVSFGMTSLLFFFLFTTLPSARVGWRDALIGALVTATLFTFGSALVGAYLGARDVARAWGDAGALVVMLLWVHYSAQIFLLGAAYTGVRARASGTLVER
jgi:membrane protein